MPSASEIVQGIKGIIQETRGALTDPLGHTLSGSLQNIVSDLPDYQDLQSDLQTARTDADNYFLNDGNLGNLAGDVAKVGGDVDGLLGDVAGLIPGTGGFGLLASGIGFLENRVGAVVHAFSDGSLDGPSASGPQPTGDSQTDGNPPPSISDQIPVSEPPGSTPISTTPPPTMPSASDTIPPAGTDDTTVSSGSSAPADDTTTPAATTGTATDDTTEPGVPSAIPVAVQPASTPVSPIDTTGLTASDIDPRQIQYLINQGDTAQAAQLQAILDQGSSSSGNVTTYGGTGQYADPGTGNNTLAFSSGATDEALVPRGGGIDTVSGFSTDAGDTIDLGPLLASAGVSLSDFSTIGNYLTSSTTGGSTALSFDPSGQGGGSVIAVLNGTSTSVSDLVAHHAITLN